jgi:hypothetical protein
MNIKTEDIEKMRGRLEVSSETIPSPNDTPLCTKETRNSPSRMLSFVKKQHRTAVDDYQKEEDSQGLIKIPRRLIIKRKESREFSYLEEAKVTVLNLKKSLRKMPDIATDTIDRNQLVADSSTQTIRIPNRRRKDIKKQANIITQPAILLLRKCRYFACYQKYMQIIEKNKSALNITSGKLTLPRIQIYKKPPSTHNTQLVSSALGQYEIRLMPNNQKKHSYTNNTFNHTEEHTDWGTSILFKAISNNEAHIWSNFAEKQILKEEEISKFLNRAMKEDCRQIRPIVESTLNNLCKNLGMKHTIDTWNTSNISVNINIERI